MTTPAAASGQKVSWGLNTVQPFNSSSAPSSVGAATASTTTPSLSFGTPSAAAPAGAPGSTGLFGTPSSGSLFGGTNTSSAATTPPATSGTPAPASSFGFNTPAAPAPSTSLFGGTTTTPAPSNSLFGSSTGLFGGSSAPAPSTGTGLFGSAAPATGGLFGSSPAPGTSSLFGGGTPAPTTAPLQQQQPPTIPAHAAMQAHHQASVQQEDQRIKSALEQVFREYTGTKIVEPGAEARSAKFSVIVYNQLTPQQRQLQWLHSSSTGLPASSANPSVTSFVDVPRPQQISEKDWRQAIVSNPDPLNYVPQALVGAQALEARKVWQQDEAKKASKSATELKSLLEFIHQRHLLTKQKLAESFRVHTTFKRRLVDVMKMVEVGRGRDNVPLQTDEVRVRQRLNALLQQVEHQRLVSESLRDKLNTQQLTMDSHHSSSSMPLDSSESESSFTPQMAQNLLQMLKGQRQALEELATTAKTDIKDVNLIGNRVVNVANGGRGL